MNKILIALSALAIVACKSNEGWQATSHNHSQDGQSIVDGSNIIPVTLLKGLSEEELAAVSEGCPRESGRDFCVAICHVPPGNPSKARTLLIPHQAVQAHISHGSDKHNHHDFVGHCSQLPDLTQPHPGCVNSKGKKKDCEDQDSSDNGDSGHNDGDHDHDDSQDDTPIFCDPLHSNDLDCDGYDDEAGTPLY